MDPYLPTALPTRLDELLTRAFDGEASPAERDELAALAGAEPRLVAMAELRDALRAALAVPGPVDVAGAVMAALDADAAWAPLGVSLSEAVSEGVRGEASAPSFDFADAVMAELAREAAWTPLGTSVREAVEAAQIQAPAIDIADLVMGRIDADAELSAYFDGELDAARTGAVAARLMKDPAGRDQLTAFATLGEDLRSATHRGVDVWPGVAERIGVEPDAVHGWEAVAGPLREAFAAIPAIDIAGAVMAAVEPVVVRMPRWASLGGPLVGFAMAAALLFAVLPMSATIQSQPASLGGVVQDLRLAAVNDALVEEITAPGDVVVQVMQFEAGGPTFILVDDQPSGSGVPL